MSETMADTSMGPDKPSKTPGTAQPILSQVVEPAKTEGNNAESSPQASAFQSFAATPISETFSSSTTQHAGLPQTMPPSERYEGAERSQSPSEMSAEFMSVDGDSDAEAEDQNMHDASSQAQVNTQTPGEDAQHSNSVPLKPRADSPVPSHSQQGHRTNFQHYSSSKGIHHLTSSQAPDLLPRIKGMFRLLDLYSESGSGGLVEKVVIDQDSLRNLINILSPKAYYSITRIDFAKLDRKLLKVTGVYGSKSEIVRLLQALKVIDERIATYLLLPSQPKEGVPSATLRSGLYLLFPPAGEGAALLGRQTGEAYVIYWPEDTTWDDQAAIGAVRKNRVTFMRYLNRLADQIVALISPEHGDKLVWKATDVEAEQDLFDFGEDDDAVADSDRFFEFEVVIKKEQDEGVVATPGFTVHDKHISLPLPLQALGPSLDLPPQLVASESRQAFLTARIRPPQSHTQKVRETFTTIRLQSFLRNHQSIQISDSISEDSFKILMEEGNLKIRTQGIYQEWLSTLSNITKSLDSEFRSNAEKMKKSMTESRTKLRFAIRAVITDEILSLYPHFDRERLYNPPWTSSTIPIDESLAFMHGFLNLHPELVKTLKYTLKEATLHEIISNDYTRFKKRFLIARNIIFSTNPSSQTRHEIIHSITRAEDQEPNAGRTIWATATSFTKKVFKLIPGLDVSSENESMVMKETTQPDPDFLRILENATQEDAEFEGAVQLLKGYAFTWAQKRVDNMTSALLIKVENALQTSFEDRAKKLKVAKEKADKTTVSSKFRHIIQEKLSTNPSSSLIISEISPERYNGYYYGNSREFKLRAQYEVRVDPAIDYRMHFLELTQEDRHCVRENSRFVPTPKVHAPTSFSLPIGHNLVQTHLLGSNRCLLIVDTPAGICFYLGDPHGLARGPPTKQLPRTVKSNTIFAVDESKRLLALVMTDSDKLTLQLFAFDETFSSIHSRGSPLPVTQWYQDGPPRIKTACFISGSEDLCLLEVSGRVRSFSFISQTFRPATLQLPVVPSAFFSAPDGSAVLAVESRDEGFTLRAFHTATFGTSSNGIVPSESYLLHDSQCFSITSLENRSNIYLLSLNPSKNSIQSISLQISKKSTDFQYHSKSERRPEQEDKTTYHNSLIDCLSDVWTRFPVVPAIKRDPISADTRKSRSITYVTDSHHDLFQPYFTRMIRDFEKSTHKPTDRRLDSIAVRSFDFNTLLQVIGQDSLASSSFKAGEWLVELLCLIPIHIAIARENRFVPLNNGVIDPTLEQRLLGAEVSQIVDALNLGWYESIFNSYMAIKPVKVISSMGEQSVGKSYALNHIVDSSFAGSAVRTTEGVWLSLCPTRDFLVVALDFEGVHSIERTAQEDMLLVLFNTAISNMVIFRNNFALSRDVANMFTSFQSSTSVLDPASNRQLFKGLLVVVIKDVVDADNVEIVKEFRSKFTQIVSEEQGTNFITVLHGGQNLVVPWPVIQSREFYTLFSKLRVRLLQQPVTHRSAGEFLLTLKTLMAKLKAQDWGALDQNLTKHRVATLLALLPTAMISGFAEFDPEREPLKNLENQSDIPDHDDTYARFCVSRETAERQSVLSTLLSDWRSDAARYNLSDLETHLQMLVEDRIAHVREWLEVNTARFSSENADVRGLKRDFESVCDILRASVQICGAECGSCRLPCTLVRLHERNAHDCCTSHQCLDDCEFLDDHEEETDHAISCGLPAGHIGRHMCGPTAHCCGAPCDLSSMKGCQQSCMKVVDHDDPGHSCSARTHQCGLPCDLQNIQNANGIPYSCPNICAAPHDEEHDRHACGDALSCPMQCELCPRLCALGDHFHGLDLDAMHLCRQEHACGHRCAAPGICEINTAPRSVETTFTGVYETFQYTKYTQVAKRLPCAIPVKAGERDHKGDHIHTLAKDPFHYCEATCPNCGYICTLPLGHSQAQHETAHGSMDNTAWAIEGAVDAAVELQGRKYAPQDVGAPHMCNLVCSHQGRHAHIDYCRSQDPTTCQESESLHIDVPMVPHPDRPKDWVSHALFWKRAGFRDPYSKDEQTEFACCDVQCAGTDHEATSTHPAQPSYCTLPIFHPPQPVNWTATTGQGYVSNDGHAFNCVNPNNLRQAFHVMFVLDKSGSMSINDRKPLANTPWSARIAQRNNNRFGAVLSALDAFWSSRNSNVTTASPRRDAYSVILFDHTVQVAIENDFTSTPDALLTRLLNVMDADGGTNFNAALQQILVVMQRSWSTDLSPVVIFLSDGEARVDDTYIHDLCNRAVSLGKPLSFHSVSFGDPQDAGSLRRMVQIGDQTSKNAPRDPLAPLVPCSFTDAIDTIRLAETFMTIAESLKKPRASLIRS